ncbi:MAG: tyrosine-type recombinase/integrase [Bdellovibrionales bacterium]|nr:tyrosine-type recombinase/integrase [Massilia sp.]
MIDAEKWDVDDATPVAALENGGIGPFVADPGMFHDVPLVDAKTDSELARAYLLHAELAPTTLKSTTTEVGRFLLWCQAHGKVLAAIRVEDLLAYKTFLRDPQPSAQWISSTRWPRRDPRWRPFAGPLGEPSIRQAFRVAKALLTFGVNAGYLRRNPGVLVKNIKTSRDARVTRYLSVMAINFIYAAINALPGTTPAANKARARERFLFIAYLTTGARLSEIVAATMGVIYTEGDGRWWLDVIGKGAKPRRLPVSTEMLAAFRLYRGAYALLPATSRDDSTPMVLNTRGRVLVAVTDEAAANAIKNLLAGAAKLADVDGDADSATALRNASAHWLRHTMLTTHANNGVALKTLQDTAGHASLSTTATYLHKSDRDRHDELMASLENSGVGDQAQ